MTAHEYPQIGERVWEETLPNGLTIRVVSKPHHAKACAFFVTRYGGMDLRFQLGGQWQDTPAGIAHYLEHKMFDTEDGNALQELAQNGAEPNAFTSNAITAYYFYSTEHFYENLKILLQFVSIPYFTKESVEKEQGIIGQEIRMMEDTPDWQIYTSLMECLYASSPARVSVAGTVESIRHITAETLYDCHKVFYNPSNMTLAVVGDVSPERVAAIAREVLPSEPGERPERDYGEAESELPVRRFVTEAMEVSAPQFIIASRFDPAPAGEARARQTAAASLALRCVTGRSSRFYSELYAEGLLKQDFSAELDYSAGSAAFLAGGESSGPEAVLERLNRAVEDFASIDSAAFERQRHAYYGALLRSLDSFENTCVSLVECRFAGYALPDIFSAVESVTKDEAIAFAKSALAPEKLALSVVTPKGQEND